MPQLGAPKLVSQLDGEPDEYDHCGQACVTSVLVDSGVSVTLAEIVSVAGANGWQDGLGETTPQDLVATLAHFGVGSVVASGLPSATDQALSWGCESICLVNCNGDGVPTAPPDATADHWLLCFGSSSAGYSFMQPLGPTPGCVLVLSAAQFAAVQASDCVQLTAPLPKDLLSPGSYVTPRGSTLTIS